MTKKLILVSNDDGIDSPGIYQLVKALRRLGEVRVVAPDRQQSAVGHALSVSQPLRAIPFRRDGEMFGYAINGTPADCVKLAIFNLLERKPDIVVSGINHGSNTGINTLYSGTVSAATEGMLAGIPSIAVSITEHSYDVDTEPSAEIAAKIAEKILETGLPKGTLLSVNVPNIPKSEINGIRITELSESYWEDNYERREDPWGRPYYWFAGEFVLDDKNLNGDEAGLKENYVTITPIKYQFTDKEFIKTLATYNFD